VREFADLGESTFPVSGRGGDARSVVPIGAMGRSRPCKRFHGISLDWFSLSLSSMSIL